ENYVPEVVGDSIATVEKKLRSKGVSEKYTIAELRDQLKGFLVLIELFVGKDSAEYAEIEAEFAELEALLVNLEESGVTELEDRIHRGCGGEVSVYATFANGELMFAETDDLTGVMPTAGAWRS